MIFLVTTNNWRLEYKYLKAKYKRIKNYPKYQMMGLLGRMKKIERETEYIPGFSYYDCDVVAVTFGNNYGNNNNNGRIILLIYAELKYRVRYEAYTNLRIDSHYYIL